MICRICRKAEGEWLADDGTVLHSCPPCRKRKNGQNLKRNNGYACNTCGEIHSDKKPNGYPYKLCKPCREKGLEAVKRRKSCLIDGQCLKCKSPTVDGNVYCTVCKEWNRLKAKNTERSDSLVKIAYVVAGSGKTWILTDVTNVSLRTRRSGVSVTTGGGKKLAENSSLNKKAFASIVGYVFRLE